MTAAVGSRIVKVNSLPTSIEPVAKGNKMYSSEIFQNTEVVDQTAVISTIPLAEEVSPSLNLSHLIAALSPDASWGDRQAAARKLGCMRCQEAVPALLAALPTDPFWMVRCAIIQALEMIDDPAAIPVLEQVAVRDSYHVVCAYAAKAVKRLS
jgi:hypothetical protein